jgi:Double zinc ribbon
MPPLAYFGIESSGLSMVIDLLILFVVVLYLSLIYWTYADARRRIADPMLVACATAASLFPFVGTIIYIILRPPEYLEDVRERELEMQAAEARLHELDSSLCPHCDYRIERDFIRCPSCLRKLKERCANCSRPLDKEWTICPYCETEVPPSAVSRRARRRRAQRELENPQLAGPTSDRPSLEEGDIGPIGRRAGTDVGSEADAELPAFSISDEDTKAAPVVGPTPATPATRAAGARTREANPGRAPEDL